MGDVVMVQIPVSPRTAERLRDEAGRARAGQILDRELGALGTDDDPLFKLIREIKGDARAAGITDEEIDAGVGRIQSRASPPTRTPLSARHLKGLPCPSVRSRSRAKGA